MIKIYGDGDFHYDAESRNVNIPFKTAFSKSLDVSENITQQFCLLPRVSCVLVSAAVALELRNSSFSNFRF